MPPKRAADANVSGESKKGKAITMEVKLDIIKRSEKGETPSNIGKALSLSRSTVGTIVKYKARILEHVKGSAPVKATVITKQRSGLIIEMERLLVLWLEDQNHRRMPISLMLIQEKAKSLFEKLKAEKGPEYESEEFAASRGWFYRLKPDPHLTSFRFVPYIFSTDDVRFV
ncbi:Uncharacterised protein r2_g2849 [Pycnogonum litorale]